MPASDIEIKGAREHNLRDVDLVLPRNQLICLTGVSGSGKSSLAFDTVFAEGQRRYVESLSSFARQFLGQMPKPDVDFIGGLSPSISISQKAAGTNPRSTVGTITEIHDYLRILFARVGDGRCPKCHRPITAQSRDQIIDRVMAMDTGTPIVILGPIIRGQKGAYRDLFESLRKQGFVRARVDGQIVRLEDDLHLDRQMRHTIEVVTDRLTIETGVRARLAEAIDMALKMGEGNLIVHGEPDETTRPKAPKSPAASDAPEGADDSDGATASGRKRKRGAKSRGAKSGGTGRDVIYSIDYACTRCGLSFDPPSPQLFSFNSPQGMCLECDGLGEAYTFDVQRLIPNPDLSFRKGAIEPIGKLTKMGRWFRHIFKGVAETVERTSELPPGTMLDTPWHSLDATLQDYWLWGTGDLHITFTWRAGSAPRMYGGEFEGVIPRLLAQYQSSKSPPQIRKLEKYMRTMPCPECAGKRLNQQACWFTVTSANPRFASGPERKKSARPTGTNRKSKTSKASGTSPPVDAVGGTTRTLPDICAMSIADACDFFSELQLDPTRQLIASEVLKEIRGRLGFLLNVGLDYLTLDRTAPTLSGGESQRIRLAGQIGSGLVGVLYILDEPSIGLHPRDNDRLLATLSQLRDVGNTVLVVEHDEDTMRHADHIIDFGPGPGIHGGEVVAQGTVDHVMQEKRSVTGKFLSGKLKIDVPKKRRTPDALQRLVIQGACHNNLKDIDVTIPLGLFVCVTGVSGSGKSSLVNDILVQALRRDLNGGKSEPGQFRAMEGLEFLDKMIAIDQTPIGRTPRSNPGTYVKVFDDIRKLFSELPDSRRRGFAPGRFSFNVQGGRCQACDGNGSHKLEMDFLADVWVTCPVCQGHRFNRETLGIQFKGHSIADILEMDVQQALDVFENIPKIHHKLNTLKRVGLDYLKIGQPSPTLSGGEAQRIKLARELVKKSTGKTLYLLDEPTTGLHFADIQLLLKVLHDFVDAGNTVLVVEHNQDVIKTADWLIDLGPEGGKAGGKVVGTGTPEQIVKHNGSHTAAALAPWLVSESGRAAAKRKLARSSRKPATRKRRAAMATHVHVQGARQHNLRDVSAKIPRDAMTVFCGPSGSGKSSLAMDTIYAEGQRRYVESLSAYARQFVNQMQKPRLESIDGLSPAIAIEQQNSAKTPRSTVGTTTEIYDYLRILMARLGTQMCPDCDVPVGTQTSDEVIAQVMGMPARQRVLLLAPVQVDVGQEYEPLWDDLRASGYTRVRIDGITCPLDATPEIDRRRRHMVEVVVDRVVIQKRSASRIAESCEAALSLGNGVMHVVVADDDLPEHAWETIVHSQHLACHQCGRSFEPLTPHRFSFNSSLGWCPECDGLGTQTGANPAALLRDNQLTLAQGALLLWPDLDQPVAQRMLQALSDRTRVPLDTPYCELSARQRRVLLHGTGETWFEVTVDRDPAETARPPEKRSSKKKSSKKKTTPGESKTARTTTTLFRFQFKGMYPALEQAARLSPSLRARLNTYIDEVECSSCGGSRLRDDAAATRFRDATIDQLCRLPLGTLQQVVKKWRLNARQRRIAGELVREITSRVKFLNDVGLEYLSLHRTANSLSGGEAQRIRLASQLGSGLCGVLYVLDEPTIGLHPRDNGRLLQALHGLRDLGNTLLVVEHDRDVIAGSDQVVDFGPKSGKFGGDIVARGTPRQIARRRESVTGPYLNGKKTLPVPSNRRPVVGEWSPPEPSASRTTTRTPEKTAAKRNTASKKNPPSLPVAEHDWLRILGARHHNLRNIDVAIPLARLVAITGVSGSGKSSLIDDILYHHLAAKLHRASTIPGAHDRIEGIEQINKVIRVDQQPLGNAPTSNPATYTGVFDPIRELFAQMPESRLRGYTARRFSFNVPGGRCEECEGNGQLCIEMHFLPDVWIPCDTCGGKRYNPETLAVEFLGRSIADVLESTCGEALELFANVPRIRRVLQTLCDVGLDYLTLGQSAPTLSGGEAQRVKLASELSRPYTGRTLYLLDEPTTGLHFTDLEKLMDVIQRLVDLGNTVVVIEHNLDVIKSADWIIDIGPDAGAQGGQVVVTGTPETVAEYATKQHALAVENARNRHAAKTGAAKSTNRRKKNPRTPSPGLPSPTGLALHPVLESSPKAHRALYDPATMQQPKEGDLDISDLGHDARMPWETNGRLWHTRNCIGRDGKAVKWDGRILDAVIQRIEEHGGFAETNWNARTIVEVTGPRKSEGWFLHALTGETWMLKLKFRVARGTFRRDTLLEQLALPTLNQMEGLPIYGNEPRVRLSNPGSWQELELRLHTWEEADTKSFWNTLDQAINGFHKRVSSKSVNPRNLTPWKVLGEKWHYLPKGFPRGKKVAWKPELLQRLCQILESVAPGGSFIWTNKQLVHFLPPGMSKPWASIQTKRVSDLQLILRGPRNAAPLGRVADLAHHAEISSPSADQDAVKIQFVKPADIKVTQLATFLSEHLAIVQSQSTQP